MLVVLALPKDCYHPPTSAIVHQLDAVDAALKWFRIAGSVPRLVSAENVNDLAKLFRLSCSFAFVETFFLKKTASSFHVLIHGQDPRTVTAALPRAGWNQTRAGNKQ